MRSIAVTAHHMTANIITTCIEDKMHGSVIFYSDADSAVKAASKAGPDMIFFDSELGIDNVNSAINELQLSEETKNIPVFLLVNKKEEAEKSSAVCILKSLSINQMAAVLKGSIYKA